MSIDSAEMDGLKDRASPASDIPVGQENLSGAIPPHESYEGAHRWDPTATWTPEEEAQVVRISDKYLLSWLCVMVCAKRFICRWLRSNSVYSSWVYSSIGEICQMP